MKIKLIFLGSEISINGFHKFDDHPNKIGYKKIRDVLLSLY